MGTVDHKKVGALDLYRIFKAAKTPRDFRVGLQAMNLFYNFGVKLRHRELATRLMAAAMACQVQQEAVELIKLYGTWLEHPPDPALVYAVMGHFLDAGEPHVVRDIAKAVREDWRMPLEAPLYILAIEAMLKLPEDPLVEALKLHADAAAMRVMLPAQTHICLLNACLEAFQAASAAVVESGIEEIAEESSEERDQATQDSVVNVPAADDSPPGEDAVQHLSAALTVADRLAGDGHLRHGVSAATACSTSWLLLHLASLPEKTRTSLMSGRDEFGIAMLMQTGWAGSLQSAVDNFGCHWGFSASLPRGFFCKLEAMSDPDAVRLVRTAQDGFGRFYPQG